MNIACRLGLGVVLLIPIMATNSVAQNQPLPKVANSAGIEVGKHPFSSSATFVCGPLEPVVEDYPFDPKTYGKVRGFAPVRAGTPLVLYTCTLDAGFFRLAASLDALVAKNPTRWANSLVIISEEKGAQGGGYSAEEVIQRLKSLRTLATRHRLTHLSFFLSAPSEKSITQSLKLTGSEDMLLATLDRPHPPHNQYDHPVVHSALRLDSSTLTKALCKETVTSLVQVAESK